MQMQTHQIQNSSLIAFKYLHLGTEKHHLCSIVMKQKSAVVSGIHLKNYFTWFKNHFILFLFTFYTIFKFFWSGCSCFLWSYKKLPLVDDDFFAECRFLQIWLIWFGDVDLSDPLLWLGRFLLLHLLHMLSSETERQCLIEWPRKAHGFKYFIQKRLIKTQSILCFLWLWLDVLCSLFFLLWWSYNLKHKKIPVKHSSKYSQYNIL